MARVEMRCKACGEKFKGDVELVGHLLARIRRHEHNCPAARLNGAVCVGA